MNQRSQIVILEQHLVGALLSTHVSLSVVKPSQFFNERPPKKRLSKAEFSFLRSPQNYQLQFFLRYSVPSSMMNVLAAVSPNSGA